MVVETRVDRSGRSAHLNIPGRNDRERLIGLVKSGRLDPFISGDCVVEIGHRSHWPESTAIVSQATCVDLDQTGQWTSSLAETSCDAVLAHHALERIDDYRKALKTWFGLLKTGGYLILLVHHQFLFERKLQPPSLWNRDHKRFYTAASLMREVEEALPASAFRLRRLEEDDEGFDYDLRPDAPAVGGCDLVCVLQKIGRPDWTDTLFQGQTAHPAKTFRRQPSQTGRPEPVRILASETVAANDILVLKLDHRGDFIMATDGFQALRRNFPTARITLACGPWNVTDAEALGLFDHIVPFALFPENASQGRRPFKTLQDAQRAFNDALDGRSFDLALDLRLDEDTRFLLEEAPARHRAGFGVREAFDYLDITVAFRRETVEGRAEQRIIGADRFFTPMLEHRGYAITMAQRWDQGPAFLIYGPYEPLAAGAYWIDVMIEALDASFAVGFDIVSDRSNTVLSFGELDVTRADRIRLPLTLTKAVEDLELRIKSGPQPVQPFRFLGCMIHRAGSLQGVHQREAMLALVEIATARLMRPYGEGEADAMA